MGEKTILHFRTTPSGHLLSFDTIEQNKPFIQYHIMIYPAGTWRKYNVASTSMQRHDVASTLRRRYIYVMCLLLHRRLGDVIFTSCACRVGPLSLCNGNNVLCELHVLESTCFQAPFLRLELTYYMPDYLTNVHLVMCTVCPLDMYTLFLALWANNQSLRLRYNN